MSASERDEKPPERILSAALHAQAAGGAQPTPEAQAPPAPEKPPRLPVLRVLLTALLLGILAGGLAGAITLL
ncbi:hypothetical protein [Actinopolyspora mortivallis]|uniref:hypothetical protein n=1 Tax=Actinopolyspora mortivallis TaxID=33906 RepID=UPI00035FF6A9|nr:hypothetical protein [Actinopolyspora mortivallis]